jgi:sulfate adenylyltransferase|tara:strand:- start:909 stop:2585 length:1677 start_codon:yes stop_codon:yes gene_type:complete
MTSLFVDDAERSKVLRDSINFPSWTLRDRQINDLELIINGAFAPLTGFMNEDDYNSVVKTMRLVSEQLFPMPITLDVSKDFASNISKGDFVALRDPEGLIIAALHVESIFQPDLLLEAQEVFGTNDVAHPAVDFLLNQSQLVYLGGRIIGLNKPRHFDFLDIRQDPSELKDQFKKNGWDKVVAFQTRNPMHRAHFEILSAAALEANANILIHPVVGLTKPGDVDHYTRTKCYKEIIKKFDEGTATLSLLPLAMRMGGPREALWHAIIRKNYGVTHFIIGRDHAGPGKDSSGIDFYGPYDAQDLVEKYKDEIGIKIIPFKMQVYVKESQSFKSIEDVTEGETAMNVSGTELREILKQGQQIPDWFTFPEVANILQESYPKRQNQGFTVFFTGLSGAGKSTIANGLVARVLEGTAKSTTLLDGDIVRQHLSSELGFSKEHRNINIQRIAYVASEITKHSGIAICAPIAPYTAQRDSARKLVEPFGTFIEVYVSTSFEVCEDRDVKGLYAKARKGLIKGFTGLDDPYEAPTNPEIEVDGSSGDPALEVEKIYDFLLSNRLI